MGRSTGPRQFSARPGYRGGWDAFVAETDPRQRGTASLIFSTYLGGTGPDEGNDMAIDTNGNVYVTDDTASRRTFPTKNTVHTLSAGGYDAFITNSGQCPTSSG